MRRPPRTSRRRTKGERQPQGENPSTVWQWLVIEHSPDAGGTWNEIDPGQRSPIRVELVGNLYRWHQR